MNVSIDYGTGSVGKQNSQVPLRDHEARARFDGSLVPVRGPSNPYILDSRISWAQLPLEAPAYLRELV